MKNDVVVLEPGRKPASRTTEAMRTITLEEHFVTQGFLNSLKGRGDMPPQLQEVQQRLLEIGEQRIASMDEGQVDLQVLSLAASGLDKLDEDIATGVARDVNDELASAVRKYPQRFAGFATVAPQNPLTASKEFARCIEQLGFVGLMLDGTTQGEFYDQPAFAPIFEVAEAFDVPIYLHPAPPPEDVYEAYFSNLPGQTGHILSIAGWGWHSETALHVLRLIVAGVFDRYPDLKIIIGHMGEGLPYFLDRCNNVLTNVTKHLSLSPAEYFLRNVYVTTSGFFTKPPFECARAVLGLERLMYSVDYPFSSNWQGREFLDSLGLSKEDLDKLAGSNAERLLKLRDGAPSQASLQ